MREDATLDISAAALSRVKAIWGRALRYPPLQEALQSQRESDAQKLLGIPVEPVEIDGSTIVEALRQAGADDETMRYFFVYLAALETDDTATTTVSPGQLLPSPSCTAHH